MALVARLVIQELSGDFHTEEQTKPMIGKAGFAGFGEERPNKARKLSSDDKEWLSLLHGRPNYQQTNKPIKWLT